MKFDSASIANTVAFIITAGGLFYLLKDRINKALDKKRMEIIKEIDVAEDEAKRMDKLYLEHSRKLKEAPFEFDRIIDNARIETDKMRKRKISVCDESLVNKAKISDERIRQMEIKAVSDIKRIMAAMVIEKTEIILRPQVAKPRVAGPRAAGPQVAGRKSAKPQAARPRVAKPQIIDFRLPQKKL